jgi:predicted nucleic acid-binding protein
VKPIIVLDSSPLGLLFQRPGVKAADACRTWLAGHVADGRRIVVPEIVCYELRRELLRLRKTKALRLLAEFNRAEPSRYLTLTSGAIDLAAELWAQARQRGTATAHSHALDIDVILAAQVLTASYPPDSFVVATSNVSHLAQFLPAQEWARV